MSSSSSAEHLSGPDQLLPADNYVAVEVDGAVKLRMGDAYPDFYQPLSVPTLLAQSMAKGPDHLAMMVKRDGRWQQWTYRQYHDDARCVAKAFIKLGLKPRHGVAILGFNAPEWFLSDLGAVFAGGLAAGVYPTNSPDACKHILQDCRANIIVVEDEKQLAKILPFRHQLTEVQAVVQYMGTPREDGVISWQQLLGLGRAESDDDLEDRLRRIAINQCCHLVYTSGTTGPPKGVMLSHDNLTFTSKRLCDIFVMRDMEERIVSFLPLSHVAANITDLFTMMTCVGTVYFADRDAMKGTLTKTLQEALPTLFLAVPRVWEKIHEKMLEVGRQNKGLKKQIGNWAKKTGLQHNQALMNGGSGQPMKYTIANTLVFNKVKAALGLNKCQRFYSAAAPTSPETTQYFLSLDIRLLEIYGMSECSGPHLSNTYESIKQGTIGKQLPGFYSCVLPVADNIGVEMKEGAGELCAKGRHVMMGYHGMVEKTRQTLTEDGWLRSGDIAIEDGEGYVTITGRIKELIITAGGENVPPVLIEDAVKRELPCLSNAMVVGDRKKFLACFMTFKVDMDPDTLEPSSTLAPVALAWCEAIGSKATTVADTMGDEKIHRAIQEGVNRANASATSNAQKVQKWLVLPQDFSVPGGELGPTLKMKRHVVLEKHQSQVEGFYK